MRGFSHQSRSIVAVFLFMILHTAGICQDSPVRLQRKFNSGKLKEFIEQAERESGLRFFVESRWMDSINVPTMPAGEELREILGSILVDVDLSYYMDGNSVYIFPGNPIITSLPDYEEEVQVAIADPSANQQEQEYLQTKKISETNYITIGSRQNATGSMSRINGSITNMVTGEPLIGATVYIKENGKGTISDAEGHFVLRIRPGEYTVQINHMAMKEMQYGLIVLSDGSLDIELENELIELEEVTISDDRQDNVQGMLMGFERISSKSIKEIPLVLGEKDILKVAQMLPGVQNVGEGSAGFNVRGGSADQNMFYINNISVYNTSHLFGFFTSFSPDIISDFSLYKNNIPSKYGGRIASIFEINTRQGNKENFFAQGGLSPVTGHFMVEGPLIRDKVSVVASVRSTYSDWLLRRIDDKDIRESNASFWDGSVGINAQVNQNNRFEAFYYQSSDRFSLGSRNDYAYSNAGGSFSWRHSFTDALILDLSASRSEYTFSNTDKNNLSEAFSHTYSINHTEGRADFIWNRINNHRIEFGVNSIYYDLARGDILPFGTESSRVPVYLGNEYGMESAAYISDEFRLLPRLSLLLGVRYSYYNQLGPVSVNEYRVDLPKDPSTIVETETFGDREVVTTYSGFEPRASMNLAIGMNTSIKAAYNRLQQYIFLLSNTIAIAPTDQWKLTDYHITPPSSDQVSIGLYHDFEEAGINTSVEVYKKWISNVVEYKDGADFISPDPLETQILQGAQDSRGVELMIRKTKNDLTGWLSYTYSRSTVTIDDPLAGNRINNGDPFPSNYDRPHSLNLVSNYRVSRRVSFSTNMVYMTGRPVTLPISTYYSEGKRYLLYSDRNKYRIPDYFRVDFSFNLEGNLRYKKLAHSFWMLNIYNLTGRKNAYSVFYEAEVDDIKGYKLSIFAQPIVTLSWNFKFGNYNSQ